MVSFIKHIYCPSSSISAAAGFLQQELTTGTEGPGEDSTPSPQEQDLASGRGTQEQTPTATGEAKKVARDQRRRDRKMRKKERRQKKRGQKGRRGHRRRTGQVR